MIRRKATAAPKRRPRIVLFGLFGAGNFGNDGSLETVLEMLRQKLPEAEILCVCANPGLIEDEFGIAAVLIRIAAKAPYLVRKLDRLFLTLPGRLVDLAHALRTMWGTDIMLMPGTGILDDFGDRPNGMPLYIYLWCLSARLAGSCIAYVSVGAGPINHPLSRWFMLSAARLAHYRSFRDVNSRNYLAKHGLDTRSDALCPDVVFSLAAPAETKPQNTHLTVGLGVMDYHGWYGRGETGNDIYRRYIEKLADFAVHLTGNGHRIRLLIGQNSDENAAMDLMRLVSRKVGERRAGLIAMQRCSSLHDLMDEIARTDIVVATRYHNIICALKMGRPSISIEYAAKNTAVMNAVGLGEFCEHAETFSTAGLIQKFDRLTKERSRHEAQIRSKVAEFGNELEAQNAVLLSLIAGKMRGEWSVEPVAGLAERAREPTP